MLKKERKKEREKARKWYPQCSVSGKRYFYARTAMPTNLAISKHREMKVLPISKYRNIQVQNSKRP
jgi:hypothetical protein